MVMHARKLPRLDDGYFDKHQSHPYQPNPKYNNSKGNYDRYNNERTRDSPNGTSLRSDSPGSYGDSPRDRAYIHKGSYAQRMREKERERDNRSPRERERQREAERRTNHDRGTGEEKPQRVGDWSEHVSSSGKKYYYNCKTEVSQWEKPREWVEWEKERERERERYRRERERDRERKYERPYSSRTASGPSERHSNFNRPTTISNSNTNSNILSVATRQPENRENHRNTSHPSTLQEQSQIRRHSYAERPSQDMDISPADSTPTSEASGPKVTTPYTPDPRLTPTTGTGAVSLAAALPRLLSHPPTSTPTQQTRPGIQTPNASTSQTPSLMSPLATSVSSTSIAATSLTTTSNSLTTLHQILTQLARTTPQGPTTALSPTLQTMLANTLGSLGNLAGLGSLQNLERMELPAPEVLQSLQTLLLTSQSASTPVILNPQPKNVSSLGLASSQSEASQVSIPTPLETDSVSGINGPPTPTHSERQDPPDFRRGSPAASLSSLSAAAASLRPTSSSQALTPSLAAHFRPDLISHVTGWPAEHLEKQAQRVSEELHSLGNLHVTKVSAELKMARSLVRVADIQATLQEQRILFLRQQMKELEELKPPNHFMSD